MKFERVLQELSSELQCYWPATYRTFPFNDPFLLTACLQKSLRRSNVEAAHGAARALLRLDPTRLWKRMVIIAFEDFGMSNNAIPRWVVAAACNQAWRKRVGGDPVVLAFLIDVFLRCPRDRRVDELYMLAVANTQAGKSRVTADPGDPLSHLLGKAADVVLRCERHVPFSGARSVMPERCDASIRAACAAGELSNELADICIQARKTSRCLLPVIYPLAKLASAAQGRPVTVVHNPVPEVRQLGLIPSFVLDGYTRVGLAALSTLVKSTPKLADLIAPLPDWAARKKAMTNILFAVEGGICTSELSDPLYDELKQHSIGCWTGLSRPRLSEATRLMHQLIPKLNDIRALHWKSFGGAF